ncbi:MAG TPA: AraC family transcriptional regulator ligand-binding domain-containing protein, partial [Polyangiaceae bacterium]|nr:AraC family transcriptional regulator ligand-binding domain-containing protein [Polyangiaceae bacterium]
MAGQLLAAAGIDPAAVDNETGWVSQLAAKRALRAVSALLGRDAVRHRGEWVTHPEALGVLVRMLRASERPVDAYRYLAQHAREVTRVGTWSIEEPAAGGKTPTQVRLTYRPRGDAGDDAADRADADGEELLCDARVGELGSFPRIWGMFEAEVAHETCLAKGAQECIYDVRWKGRRSRDGVVAGALAASAVCGPAVAVAGGGVAGALAAGLGALLGGATGFMWDRSREERSARVFEHNRIAALER